MQVLSALIAVCGAVTLSRMNLEDIRREMENLKENCNFDKLTTKYNILICCALLLFICGGTLLLGMILLTVSFILKCSKVFVIVVSYMYHLHASYNDSVFGIQLH